MQFSPSFSEILTYSKQYRYIPMVLTTKVDTVTPVGLFCRLTHSRHRFLFESVEVEAKLVRYSMMGQQPECVLKAKDGMVTQSYSDGRIELTKTNHPMQVVDQLIQGRKIPTLPNLPSFLGGAVGYVAFEMIRYFEPHRAVTQVKPSTGAYDFHLMFLQDVIVYDHFLHEIHFVTMIKVEDQVTERELYQQVEQKKVELQTHCHSILSVEEELAPLPSFLLEEEVSFEQVKSNFTPEVYRQVVEKAQEFIRKGDIFQIVPSQRWTIEKAPDPMDVYRVLRLLNPSPYMFFLQMEEETIVGTSPELMVKVTDGLVETRPIAGSRPRGKHADEDQMLMNDLLSDSKEIAEHVMLVDLGRNDVGRVARYGSVQVTEQMKVEKYSHVMHLVSHVTGQLVDHQSAISAFQACFPAGTVSGAPKIRAMELIAQLEPEQRGVYAGAVGYFGFNGNLDTCIAIRTIYFRDGKAYLQAGGGVVADSNPQKEYEETCHKAKALLKAIRIAEKSRVEVEMSR